jgi:hypothetical protein
MPRLPFQARHHASPPPEDSYDYYFSDGRDTPVHAGPSCCGYRTSEASWLADWLFFRSIGAAYDDKYPSFFFSRTNFSIKFDVVVYFQTTTESALLPSY